MKVSHISSESGIWNLESFKPFRASLNMEFWNLSGVFSILKSLESRIGKKSLNINLFFVCLFLSQNYNTDRLPISFFTLNHFRFVFSYFLGILSSFIFLLILECFFFVFPVILNIFLLLVPLKLESVLRNLEYLAHSPMKFGFFFHS